jgi:hypothetical protein
LHRWRWRTGLPGCLTPIDLLPRRCPADFKVEIIVLAVLMLLMVFSPLLVYTGKLSTSGRRAVSSPLAARYAQQFEARAADGAVAEGALLITRDIQSLADMGGVYRVRRCARAHHQAALVQLLAATLARSYPCCSMMPLGGWYDG